MNLTNAYEALGLSPIEKEGRDEKSVYGMKEIPLSLYILQIYKALGNAITNLTQQTQ